MKKETNEKFEFTDVITLIALIGAVITMIFGFPHLDFPDDWCVYIFGTVALTFAYIIGFYLLVGIIIVTIVLIIGLFNKKMRNQIINSSL